MRVDKTSQSQARVLLLAAVIILSVVAVGAFPAAAQVSGNEEPNTDTTELVDPSSADRSPNTQTVVSDELAEREGTAVALLSVDRELSDRAVTTGQVNATTLQADSEATLGPVVEAASAMDGVTVRNTFWVGNIVSVTVDLDTVDPADLAAIDGVTRVAPNVEMTRSSSAQVNESPDVGINLDANFTHGLRQIDVPGFEDKYNASGEGTTVTVIDDGISNPEAGHPDLDFSIKAVAENGTVTTGTLGKPADLAHGEHVAGTATGAADPVGDVPRYGVAPNASLIKVKVGERTSVSVENILASVEFAVEQDSDVVSMSLGLPVQTPGNPVLELLMEQQAQSALAAGTVVVAAAGNAGAGDAGGSVRSPGANFNVLTVGASDKARNIYDDSSGLVIDRFNVDYNVAAGGGTEYPDHYPRQYVKPDVSAPGVDVLSSGPLKTASRISDSAATYSVSNGTSMAAPHVAGAVALIQSATDANVPAPLMRSALAETAEKPDNDFPSRHSRDIRYGTGIINVTAATDAIVDGSLTIEGEVTDSEGEPVVGATVQTEDGALTSTDESGRYTLHTTSESANVTVSGFGVESQTRLVEDDTDPVTFTLNRQVDVDLLDRQRDFVAFGGDVNLSVDVANLETMTVDLTPESTVAPEDVTVTLDGDELPVGEPVAFDETVDSKVTLSVDLAAAGNYTEGDLLGIRSSFEGGGDTQIVETDPIELTETLAPAEYEISDFSAPAETTAGGPIPISFEITNVGQQTPDSYGYQFFSDTFTRTATELNIEPGKSRTVTLSVTDLGEYYEAGEVFTHGVRVGQLEQGLTEDSVTAELALQAEGMQFNITDLDAPSTGDPGQRVDVAATVENVGRLGDTQTVNFVLDGNILAEKRVTLDAFTLANGIDSTTVTFSDVRLPDTEEYLDYGVFTEDDGVESSIGVGVELRNVTVVQNGPRDRPGELTAELLQESLPDRYGEPTVLFAGSVNASVIRETDVFVFHGLGDAGSDLIPVVENDPLTNAVYLEQWANSNAITNRADVLNDPTAVVTDSNGAAPVEFTIEQDHPIFNGVGNAGDVVPIHAGGDANVVWFENASGETLATVNGQNATDGTAGPSVTVDPDSGVVLLSTIATVVRSPDPIAPADFTPEASQILANAVEFAEPEGPEEPFFQVSGLSAPAQADPGATIDINATVTNLGNQTGTQTVEFVLNGSVAATVAGVELDSGSETVVEFTDVPLPSEGGVFEHGIQTANNSQIADIAVGAPDIELVELNQPDELTLEQPITTEITLTNNGTAPYEGELTQVTNLNGTLPENDVLPLNRTTLRLVPGESATFTGRLLTFAEINDRLNTNFAPGDNVETGYRKSQNLNTPRDTVAEEIYSEEISIVSAGPPNVTIANLRIAGQSDNATVAAGSYDVTADLSHTGGADGDVPIELTVGDKTLSKNVSLEANQTVMVTFENATSNVEPGTYDVTLSGSTDAVRGTLTLSMDDSDDGSSGADESSDDGSDGSGPGFGPGTVLVGVAGAGYLLKRRGNNDETGSS